MLALITAGNLSTIPLASTKPAPVISRTALITATLVAPTSVNDTVTLTGPVSSAAAGAAATATGAAAVTPNYSSIAFTKSFNSKIVISFKEAMISSFVNLAIFNILL